MSVAEDEPKAPAVAPTGAPGASAEEEPPQLFQIGETVRRWVIKSRIGGGAFGETYVGVDTAPESRGQEVCIKAEKQDKRPILRTEVLALKRAQDCRGVVRYISSGKHGQVNFLVMEKLGDNLADVRRRCSRGIMDLYSALQYTIACLDCIEQVHSCGLIHRDIKPSNFVLGPPGAPPYTVYIIDFGLAKRYVSSTGEIKPPRENAGFRGTSRYASIASHQQKDLGRVDDLWSLLFMAVEFITGTLPWRRVKEKDAIGALKKQHVGTQLVRYLPREMTDFVLHLEGLDYAGEPDYRLLRQLLLTTISRKQLVPPAALQSSDAARQQALQQPSSQQAPTQPAGPTATPQEQATAPAVQPGPVSLGGADEYGSPTQRARKPVIVDGEGNAGGNVILHVNTSSPESRRGLPPMAPENGGQAPAPSASVNTARSPGKTEAGAPVTVVRGPVALVPAPERDEPASPINLEMGTSMLRSGAATPGGASGAAISHNLEDVDMPRAAHSASVAHVLTTAPQSQPTRERPSSHDATPAGAGEGRDDASGTGERVPRKIPVASADGAGTDGGSPSNRRGDEFDAIAEPQPAPVHEFSEARAADDDDDDEENDGDAEDRRNSGKSAGSGEQRPRGRKRRKDRKKDDDPVCGCCVVA
mmetsp:Transcript_39217/g.121207  ORF Transcript_39217/g.121207 Transcript_39217/m.121207 type:complete len:645 (-) Transcript_39217:174-2108(-)